MSDLAVRVEGLGKKYRIGGKEQPYKTLRGSLSGMVLTPVHALARLAGHANGGPRPAGRSEFWALREVSFELRQGDVLGIIGRNGAGKSTLLKLLSRITEPTSGRIDIYGRVASLLEVGTGFHPELTGRENVILNGAILGMSRQDILRRFDEIVAFAEVEQFIDTQVKHYSTGMYMRLAFAVAAHLEPEILIVDEVLAVGDVAFQQKCLGKMENVGRSGKTVLFVSHNLESIRRLCSIGLLLESGRLRASGPINDVADAYANSAASARTAMSRRQQTDHSGFYVESIEILDLAGNPLGSPATWDGVRFRIQYHAPTAVKGASVCFQLATRAGTILTYTSTQPDNTLRVDMHEGLNTIDCVFPRLALTAGRYVIGAGLALPNIEMLYDGLDHWDLEVLPADVFNSGLAPSSTRYLIAQEHFWDIQ